MSEQKLVNILKEGYVVQILIGEYQGRNGFILKIKNNKVLVLVDPFGKTIWYNKNDIKL